MINKKGLTDSEIQLLVDREINRQEESTNWFKKIWEQEIKRITLENIKERKKCLN
jgi:hypothetical protein